MQPVKHVLALVQLLVHNRKRAASAKGEGKLFRPPESYVFKQPARFVEAVARPSANPARLAMGRD